MDKRIILLVVIILVISPVNAIVRWDLEEAAQENDYLLQVYSPNSTHLVPQESIEAWISFLEKYGQKWKAEWNVETGTLLEISGYHYDTGKPIQTDKEAQDTASEFISENRNLLKVDTSDLTLERTAQLGEAGWRVEYSQNVNGIPVHNARVVVLMTGDGKIDGVTNTFFPDITTPVEPAVSQESATETAKNAYVEEFNVSERLAGVKDSELVILPMWEDGITKHHLAWKIEMGSDSWPKRYFIDATEGGILGAQNLAVTAIAGGTLFNLDILGEPYIIRPLLGIAAASLILFAIIKKRRGRTPTEAPDDDIPTDEIPK